MNFGVIGTSTITESFIKASMETAGFNFTSVYSRSKDKAKLVAERFQATHIFTDLNEMAKSDELEVVYVASPNSLHFEQVKLFLQNKKHVICEKPIFSNVQEFEEAFKIAEDNGVYLFEAARNIHSPNFKRLKEYVKKVGKKRSAIFHYMKYSSRYDQVLAGEEPNIFSPAFSGGALVDLGVYPVFVAVSLFGEPKEVSYFPVMLPTGVDGSGTLILKYDDFVCTILCSKIVDAYSPCEIHGEDGTLIIDHIAFFNKMEFKGRQSERSEQLAAEQNQHDMVYEIEEFKRIIETKDNERYEELKAISHATLKITEEARKQNKILFDVEK